MRIGIDKDEPVSRGYGRAAVSRPADLVDRLEDNRGSGFTGEFRGVVRGVVVANHQFGLPAQPCERNGRFLDAAQRFGDELLFVECRNDDGDFHDANV